MSAEDKLPTGALLTHEWDFEKLPETDTAVK
jgi:hypothetical protein